MLIPTVTSENETNILFRFLVKSLIVSNVVNIIVKVMLAGENSWHFTMPPLVPCKETSEKWVQKCHADDALLPRSCGGGRGGKVGAGLLQISSDKDDGRIFGGLKFLILQFFEVRKFGWLD